MSPLSSPAVLPSGRQVEIRSGDQTAVVVEIGGGVRDYQVAGVPVLDGYDAGDMCTAARGLPLVPWPNRLSRGEWAFDGLSGTVPLDEPEQHNAIHGFGRWLPWTAKRTAEDAVTMGVLLAPRTWWPFTVSVEVDYALDPDGLTVTTTARNLGDRAAPWVAGQHPYLLAGGGTVDECLLTLPARTVLVDDAEQIPVGSEPYDAFLSPAPIGGLVCDSAFTDLVRGPDGKARLVFERPDGRTVSLWVDGGYPYLEVFTGDTVPEPERRRRGLGVEPMTGPPNALQTGESVVRLEPGAASTSTWGITTTGF